MNLKNILLALIVALGLSSCASTTYVVEDDGPMMQRRSAPPVVIGATAPGLNISLNAGQQCYPARPISVRPQIVRVVHECAEFRVVLLSDGRTVRQNNPNYRGLNSGGAYGGGNYGYPGNGGAYYGGAGGYPGYQQSGGRYNSTTLLPPVHPNVYGRRNGTAVTDPHNGSWNGFRSNPANAYLFR